MTEAPETPPGSPLTLETAMALPLYRRLMDSDVSPGEPAFAFELPRLHPETHRPSGERVRIADFAGERPVVLIFGSYT